MRNPCCDCICASRYIKKFLDKTNFNVYMYLLKEVTSMFYDVKCLQDIPESLSHLNLTKFGGDYSQVEFKLENKKKLDRYLMLERINII
jgi:hypothetical protein